MVPIYSLSASECWSIYTPRHKASETFSIADTLLAGNTDQYVNYNIRTVGLLGRHRPQTDLELVIYYYSEVRGST